MNMRIRIEKECPHCRGKGCMSCFGDGWNKVYMSIDDFKQLIKSILEEMI